MCGIVAVYSFDERAPEVREAELLAVREAMARRGPDGRGLWLSPDRRIGLAHRRLAIRDLDARADQPMVDASGRFRIVFNGELYDEQPLREELLARGARLRTESDTEIVLELLARDGSAALARLRGMYALALWDQRRRELLIARDPYGIKPLYYAKSGGVVRVASQVRALISGGGVARTPSLAGMAGFLLSGSVPEPFTMLREVRALRAGSHAVVSERGMCVERGARSVVGMLRAGAAEPVSMGDEEVAATVRDAVRDSVRAHAVSSDVPVGAFLSAGIDSGAIVGAFTEQLGIAPKTVTLAFGEHAGQALDEAPLAARTAERYGAEHTTVTVTREMFQSALPSILSAMDQPSIDGVNTWLVSRAASEAGLRVALSGVGGDELFGGYPAFRDVPKMAARLAPLARVPGLGRAARGVIASVLPRHRSPKLASLVEYGGSFAGAYLLRRGLFLPHDLPGVMGEEAAREGLAELAPLEGIGDLVSALPSQDWARVACLESCLYLRNQLLRDTDWASMDHSLEVRTPLVDVFLLERLAPVLAGLGSVPGKQWLADVPDRPLPEQVARRAKTGFVVPIDRWIRETEELDAWRRVPELCRDGAPWARRMAYALVARQVAA